MESPSGQDGVFIPKGSAGQHLRRAVPSVFRRAPLLTLLTGLLLGSGIYVEFMVSPDWPDSWFTLAAHILLGVLLTALLAHWLLAHIRHGLAKSQRRSFALLSWLLLVGYAVLALTGLLMVAPLVAIAVGATWFWPVSFSRALAFLHLWAGLASAGGLVVHLFMRHWAATGRGAR